MTQPIHYGAAPRQSFLSSLARGFLRRCPQCGDGALFRGYVKANQHCPSCELALDPLRTDDVAPYFTIFIVGHIVVPLVLLLEQHVAPPVWLQLALWLPATLLLTLALLPYVKGAAMAAIWHLKARDPSDTSA